MKLNLVASLSFITIFLFLDNCLFFTYTLAQTEDKLIITYPYVYLRKGPSIQEEKVGYAKKDDLLPIVEKTDNWYKVRLNDGKEGWIYGDLVKKVEKDEIEIETKTETETEKKDIKYLLVIRDEVNIRKNPDTNSTKLYCVNSGDRLEYKELNGNWYKVKYKGFEGWIHNDLITIDIDETNQKTNIVSLPKNEVLNNNSKSNSLEVATDDYLDTKNELLSTIDNLLTFYNYSKQQSDTFIKIKWFPSLDLLHGVNDIEIEKDKTGNLKAGINIYIRKICLDNLLPIKEETFLYLKESDKMFLQMLMQNVMRQSSYSELMFNLWFLRIGNNSTALIWENLGYIKLDRVACNKSLNSDHFWDMIDHNLNKSDVWFDPKSKKKSIQN
ncbi:MAG: SH3 domain-containing protein [bacterium]